MKSEEIIGLLNEIEEKFNVDQWVIDGIEVWPLVRVDIGIKLNRRLLNTQNELSRFEKLKPVFSLFKGQVLGIYSYFKDYFKNEKLTTHKDVIFLSDGISFTQLNGKWFEKFCDPFRSYFNSQKITSVYLTPLHQYFSPRHTPSAFIQSELDRIIIRSLFFAPKEKGEKETLEGYNDFLSLLEKKSLPVKPLSLKELRSKAIKVRYLADFYKKIFKRVKPKLGFAVCYYGDYGMAFNLACREEGIPSVDIQHGVQGDYHIAYGNWSKVPKTGYQLLPEYFWVWSELEKEAIDKWSQKQNYHKTLAGGNLFLNMWQDSESELVRYYNNVISDISKEGAPALLVTLQFGMSIEENMMGLLETIKETQTNYNWWIRLHPSMLERKEEIKQMLKDFGIYKFQLELSTRLPLYALLLNTDLHLTHSSSTVIEAESFLVPSVIIGEYGAKMYKKQVDSGWAIYASTNAQIKNAIQLLLNRKEGQGETKKHSDNASKENLHYLSNLVKKSE